MSDGTGPADRRQDSVAGGDAAVGGAAAAGQRRAERDRASEVLDLQEGRGDVALATAAEARALLASARRIAIVGASTDPMRPSHGVMAYLLAAGYDCVPINPSVPEVLGRTAYPDLASAVAVGGRFDIVDVFRRPETVPEVARQAVQTRAGALWMQLGVVSWEAARLAAAAGMPVVMDRCTKIEHHAMQDAQR
ncbi:MAG TPA: CoA-binding protein [Candidatus Acidoferrales bacterium]|nr:CoA-binding protein [Candidatus Acidoferrales bacterium]